jgi:hypothetical protein
MKAEYYIEKYDVAPEMAEELEIRDQLWNEQCAAVFAQAVSSIQEKIKQEKQLKIAESIGKSNEKPN